MRILILAIGFFTFSCSGKQTSVASFVKKVFTDQAFVKEKVTDQFVFRCRYLPPQYLALKNFHPDSIRAGKVTRKAFDAKVREFSRGAYFQLSLGRKDGSDFVRNAARSLSDYDRMQQYFYAGMKKDVCIRSEEGVIEPISHQYNRTYGLSPELNFLFVFPRDLPEGFTVVLKNRITSLEPKDVEFDFSSQDVSTEDIYFKELI